MAEFKAKVQKIIDQGFTKEQIRPAFDKIKKGYFKSEIKQEKKETFDIDISMKGLKDQAQEQKNKTNTNYLDKFRLKTFTQSPINEIEIREIPTTKPKGRHLTQNHLFKEVVSSLDTSKTRKYNKSKVKKEIEAFSNSLKETTVINHKELNKQPLPSILNMNDYNKTTSNSKHVELGSHQTFNLLNHKINSLLNRTNSLTNTANRRTFQNIAEDKSKSSLWTKVTSINLENDNQRDVDEFSKSFDTKMSSKERGQFLSKMDSLFNFKSRKKSEDNMKEKIILDF